MKKLFIVLLLSLAVTVVANAQDYKKFKFGFGLGPTLSGAARYDTETGIFLTLEPAYRVSDKLGIGLRIEGAATRLDFDNTYSVNIGSYTVNGQYYLNANKLRPFVGGGLGLYRSSEFYTVSAVSVFGFYPRVGFDAGHFSMSLDYNLISSPKRPSGSSTDNYLSIRIGCFVGGGRKQSSQTNKKGNR